MSDIREPVIWEKDYEDTGNQEASREANRSTGTSGQPEPNVPNPAGRRSYIKDRDRVRARCGDNGGPALSRRSSVVSSQCCSVGAVCEGAGSPGEGETPAAE